MDCDERLLPWAGLHRSFRYHFEEDETVRRRAVAVCHGTSALSHAIDVQCLALDVG